MGEGRSCRRALGRREPHGDVHIFIKEQEKGPSPQAMGLHCHLFLIRIGCDKRREEGHASVNVRHSINYGNFHNQDPDGSITLKSPFCCSFIVV